MGPGGISGGDLDSAMPPVIYRYVKHRAILIQNKQAKEKENKKYFLKEGINNKRLTEINRLSALNDVNLIVE